MKKSILSQFAGNNLLSREQMKKIQGGALPVKCPFRCCGFCYNNSPIYCPGPESGDCRVPK